MTIALAILACATALFNRAVAADDPDQLVPLVVNLLGDKDKDVRALGLQQVREEVKGAAATKQFAALLPKLAPDVQVGLLSALADRGDIAARPAVLEMLESKDEQVRAAALRALGTLGAVDDAAVLIRAFSGAAGPEKEAARASLVRLVGDRVSLAIAAAVPQAKPATRAELIAILATRRAKVALTTLVPAAIVDPDAGVRMAAMAGLAELGGPDEVPAMALGVLKASPGPEREAAERAVAAVCSRIADPEKRADPLIATFAKLSDNQTELLSTLGRVGGDKGLKIVEAAIADTRAERHAAGIRALCNWPDATIAAKLESMVETSRDPAERTQLLRALVRVAALHDKRTDAERLALLQRAMSLSTTDDERNAVVKRCRSIRTIASLRYLVPFLDKPEFAQEACASVVELAHHKELREPNKPEFDKALDTVIRIGKDPDVVDHAHRYKEGRT